MEFHERRPRRAGWLASRCWPLSLALAFSGCALVPDEPPPPESVSWRSIPLSAAWTYQPTATYAVARDVGSAVDQRVGLANDTVMPGENVLVMRAHRDDDDLLLMPRIEDFTEIAADDLGPFERPIEGVLVQALDGGGVYHWTATSGPDDETCVLAMRRLRPEDALIPGGFTALDLVLRNCVRGHRAAAMAPFGLDRVAAANVGPRPEGVRALSHLTGPRPVEPPVAGSEGVRP